MVMSLSEGVLSLCTRYCVNAHRVCTASVRDAMTTTSSQKVVQSFQGDFITDVMMMRKLQLEVAGLKVDVIIEMGCQDGHTQVQQRGGRKVYMTTTGLSKLITAVVN